MRRQKFLWFQLAALAGAGLAVLLVLETWITYRYSATRLARAEGLVQAVEDVSALEHRLSREQVDTRNGLEQILRQVLDERSEEIAWVSVIDANGQVQVSSSPTAPATVFATDRIHAALAGGENPSLVQNSAQGQILVALVALKRQLLPRSGSELPPDWRLVEIAIYLRVPQGVLYPLHRNLLVTALASFVLLSAMLVFLVRLKAYVRGRMLQEQLELARTVQQQLLPGPTEADALEFAGQCVPADMVGGDFYDVFHTERGEIALVLADVSGKGLPAALRMGVVHGAIRGLSRGRKGESVGEMAGTLNELLLQESSHQFVTLFWGFYNPTTHEFVYVNAGHLPPLLVGFGSQDVRRLEAGGPVLGLLPAAFYQEEHVRLDGKETLVAFSDGLIEATGPGGEEFGESGVLSGIRAASGQPAAQVLRQIMDRAVTFVEKGEFHDDLTVFVAKLAQKPKSARGS